MVVPIWKNLADLCNVLKKVDTSYVKLYTQKKEGKTHVRVTFKENATNYTTLKRNKGYSGEHNGICMKIVGCDNGILAEDVMMAGFVPLLSLPRLPTFVHQLVDKVQLCLKTKTTNSNC